MKWNTSSFLENRLFDSRLTKSALVNKWRIDDDIYKQRMDYRHFKETYVLKIHFFLLSSTSLENLASFHFIAPNNQAKVKMQSIKTTFFVLYIY